MWGSPLSPNRLSGICHAESVPRSASKRTHVILPVDLVADIDKLVGKRGRSAFLTDVARDEIQRRQQRIALRAASGAWKDEDHPELKDGAAAWVRQMRSESETRFRGNEQHRNWSPQSPDQPRTTTFQTR
jgi:hypothetical protein